MKRFSRLLLILCITTLGNASLRCHIEANQFAGQYDQADTMSMLNQTSREVMQAYDLLEMLKQRSAELEARVPSRVHRAGTLPRNLDAMRTKMIKEQLLTVLSATPFTSPEQHIKDCLRAAHALKKYAMTLKKGMAPPQEKKEVERPTPAEQIETPEEVPEKSEEIVNDDTITEDDVEDLPTDEDGEPITRRPEIEVDTPTDDEPDTGNPSTPPTAQLKEVEVLPLPVENDDEVNDEPLVKDEADRKDDNAVPVPPPLPPAPEEKRAEKIAKKSNKQDARAKLPKLPIN